jgi:DNA invertase Pin-like site-specific DNA recombinase
MNAAIYARTATEEESTFSQIDSCRKYASERGWTVLDIFDDTGVSSSKIDRDGLSLFVQNAHKYDILLVTSIDRLFREPEMVGAFMKGITKFQVQTIVVYN